MLVKLACIKEKPQKVSFRLCLVLLVSVQKLPSPPDWCALGHFPKVSFDGDLVESLGHLLYSAKLTAGLVFFSISEILSLQFICIPVYVRDMGKKKLILSQRLMSKHELYPVVLSVWDTEH